MTKHDLDEWKGGISDSRAESIFDTDLRVAVHAVTDQVEMPLTQNQFDALVDLAFNIGYGNFGHLSVRELLNEGDYLQAGENIRYVSGNSGRRSDESRLFAAR